MAEEITFTELSAVKLEDEDKLWGSRASIQVPSYVDIPNYDAHLFSFVQLESHSPQPDSTAKAEKGALSDIKIDALFSYDLPEKENDTFFSANSSTVSIKSQIGSVYEILAYESPSSSEESPGCLQYLKSETGLTNYFFDVKTKIPTSLKPVAPLKIKPNQLLEEVSAGIWRYRCSYCDKTFSRTGYLSQHFNSSHTGDRPFKCGICGKRFRDEEKYKNHQPKHGGNKPYKCSECPKQFNYKIDLNRHISVHTGLKPYICQVCQKGFIRKDHMHKHIATHMQQERNSK